MDEIGSDMPADLFSIIISATNVVVVVVVVVVVLVLGVGVIRFAIC